MDNAKLQRWGTVFILPATETAGIPVTVTALYGRGMKAQIHTSVPKYQLQNIGFAAYYHYIYPDRYGSWVTMKVGTGGVIQSTEAYKPVDRYWVTLLPSWNVYDPIRQRSYTGSLSSLYGARPDVDWQSDNETMSVWSARFSLVLSKSVSSV